MVEPAVSVHCAGVNSVDMVALESFHSALFRLHLLDLCYLMKRRRRSCTTSLDWLAGHYHPRNHENRLDFHSLSKLIIIDLTFNLEPGTGWLYIAALPLGMRPAFNSLPTMGCKGLPYRKAEKGI